MANKLTVFQVNALKPPASGRLEVFKPGDDGFGVRVTSNGAKSFVWRGRIKGKPESIRMTIDAISGPLEEGKLARARDLAAEYRTIARAGKDPRDAFKATAATAQNTLETAVETFIVEHVATLRSAANIEALLRRYLIGETQPKGEAPKRYKRGALAKKPIADVTQGDIVEIINAIRKDGKEAMARHVLANVKSFFQWASAPGRGHMQLKANPVVGLSAKKDFGIKPVKREVTLSNDQLRLVWEAAETLPSPDGPYVKELIRSGQRRSEVGDMSWPELDLDRERVWVIPAERMKAKRSHEVPLSPAMLADLETLRDKHELALRDMTDAERAENRPYVFSNDNGKRPIGNFSQIKSDLDAAIAKLIKEKGLDIVMPEWTFHDIRRTVRTNLGAIPSIPVDIRERVVAHVPPGLVQTYDLHDFRDEKRQALTLWADRLAQIINPPPVGANVVKMRAAE